MDNNPSSEIVEIRLAKPSDGDRMAKMSKRLIEAGLPWWCWTTKRITKSLRSSDTVGLVAHIDKSIAGFAVMYFGDEKAHLNLLAVEPELRRKGVGLQLLNWLEESCLIAGISQINLEVRAKNRGAIRFYKALGFRSGDEISRYYCGVEAALRMSKVVAKSAPM